MKFVIEQLALYPNDPVAAKELLTDMGAKEWTLDNAYAAGEVRGASKENAAELQFNYDMADVGGLELELLHYTHGDHYMQGIEGRAAHIGMHCEARDLQEWINFFADRGIGMAQCVNTYKHTNPHIAGKREYTYTVFDTASILGVFVKLIVRREVE